MELYARVRRAVVVDKKSERVVAKEFGLARETVRKMLRYAVPPGYRRQQPVRRPKLDAWVGTIDQILEDDKNAPRKAGRRPTLQPPPQIPQTKAPTTRELVYFPAALVV